MSYFDDIQRKRNEIRNNILKGFGVSMSEEDIEKAHKDGDLHPNGKWVWVSSAAGGKGDWRTLNGRTHKKHQASSAAGSGTAGSADSGSADGGAAGSSVGSSAAGSSAGSGSTGKNNGGDTDGGSGKKSSTTTKKTASKSTTSKTTKKTIKDTLKKYISDCGIHGDWWFTLNSMPGNNRNSWVRGIIERDDDVVLNIVVQGKTTNYSAYVKATDFFKNGQYSGNTNGISFTYNKGDIDRVKKTIVENYKKYSQK